MQELQNQNFDPIVSDTKIPIRLGFLNSEGVPNIISLWYEQIDGKIFCATQKTAKIVTYLEKNPECGFEIAADKPPYKGTRGSGVAKIVEDRGEEILNILMKKYLGDKVSTLQKILKKNIRNEVAIEITPKKLFHYDYSPRMQDV